MSSGGASKPFGGLVFVLAFMVLQALWGQAKGTALERLWIDTATVKTAVALIGLVSDIRGQTTVIRNE